jgi:capsule biosynthesis phosphatase
MNLIIPIGGKGERFKNNYNNPKPFINIYGHSMIFWLIDNLNLTKDDTIYIGIMEDICDQFGLEFKLNKEYPLLSFKIVKVIYQTRGPVETLFTILQTFQDKELDKPILSLDCDTLYFDDIVNKFKINNSSCSFYFNANDKPEIFSYLKLEAGIILDIQEKKWFKDIDKYGNTGAYGFKNGRLLKKYCTKLLDSHERVNNEFYISQIIKNMIKDGELFKGINIENFRCAGTPDQLNLFLKEIEDGRFKCNKIKRFCFDLDNTLVTYPQILGDYTTVKPKKENIDIVKKLKLLGHYIIIHTARRMRTHNGDVKAVEHEIKDLTIKTLKEFDIPYDELYFGKPYADLYIDDLAFNALVNTENNIGVYKKDKINIIQPRNWNNIIDNGKTIIKKSISDTFQGEIYFYKRLSPPLKKYFPKIIKIGIDAIEMEKINGIIFSELLVSKTLTEYQLVKLLDTLSIIHHPNICSKNTNIYDNYAAKIKQRMKENKDVYAKLDGSSKYYEDILQQLIEYESSNKGIYSPIIHGDTVFSNIIVDELNNIKFIDPRGKLGNVLSIEGDICYDLGKILQSLHGYDFVIMNKQIEDVDNKYLEYLRNVFYNWVARKYPTIENKDLLLICKSLIFSLIPLHSENHLRFFEIIKDI